MNPKAACVLYVDDLGRVLVVSRKGEPTMFGLPGGKVEGGEDTLQTAERELYEETGIRVRGSDSLQLLYSADDGHGYDVTTYVLVGPFEVDQWFRPECDTTVKLLDPLELVLGPFGEYNYKVFEAEAKRRWCQDERIYQ